ncbi:hypothetical protein PBRA_001834 [Plasmodiophora brassicae]|uniref:Uncharacterized protein n=1 Tax=Plasmodiophora brassicae TaxID=37360 RepID=A0A0G4J0T4_PLABS|nr:hypothetical protein PBRA_001834 [Plasmodiophora brassicae]
MATTWMTMNVRRVIRSNACLPSRRWSGSRDCTVWYVVLDHRLTPFDPRARPVGLVLDENDDVDTLRREVRSRCQHLKKFLVDNLRCAPKSMPDVSLKKSVKVHTLETSSDSPLLVIAPRARRPGFQGVIDQFALDEDEIMTAVRTDGATTGKSWLDEVDCALSDRKEREEAIRREPDPGWF